jgi:uncharacterized membrane protein
MSKEVRWLWEQSDGWVAKGLISQEQAGQIRNLYPEPKAILPWGTIIFSGLGAAVAGLGVILLLAYNWHAIPKAAKLAVIFGGLGGLHGAGIWLFLRDDWRRQLGEAVSLLGTMLFGAGIWLVAQIYHIEEHYPNGFLIWGLGALALAWAMPSLAQALLATTVLCIWGCAEGWGFDHAIHWAPLLILVSLGGLSWRMRSPLLLFFVLAAFVLTLMASMQAVESGLLLLVLLNFAVLFVAVAILTRRHQRFAESAVAWGFFGWLGFLICLYLLTFPGLLDDLLGWRGRTSKSFTLGRLVYGWIPFAVALVAWGGVGWAFRPGTTRGRRPQDCSFELWLLPLTAIVCQVFAVAGIADEKWPVAGVFNLVFLALAATWMARGCREGLLRPTILGSLLLVGLTTARYFDLFESLAVRGLIFLMVGGLLFTEGILFRHARRRAQMPEVQA